MDTAETSAPPRHGGGVKVSQPSSTLYTDLSAGLLVAFLSANYSLSYAALLFAGTAPATQAKGLVMLLVGSMVAAVIGVRLSSLPFSALFADGSLVALLATATAGAVADMAGAPDAAVAATLVTMLMLATVLTGASLWLIGTLGAGGIARFVPFQVMAGVLAASGWALASGGAAVAVGHAVGFASLAEADSLDKLAPALLLAGAMLATSARVRHPAAIPAVIVAAILLYHGTAVWAGWHAAEQRQGGWLLALPPGLTLSLPWSPATLAIVDWPVLAAHATSLLALVPMTAIVLLLGLSGLETTTGIDVAADRDLKANGLAAVASGGLGGVLGITSYSRSLLMFSMGVQGRRASLFAGLASGLVPLLWPGLLAAVPRFVLGGLLVFAGLGMLRQWVLRSRRRLGLSEWLTVLAVLAVSARFGLIAGVSTGLLLGCIAFAVIYSRASPIRARYRGQAARSRVDRPEHEHAWLARHADTVLVLHLQGFVFFGTANRLIDVVRREIASTPGRLRHLLLELGTVQGIDGSALASFERLQRLMAAERISLAFAAMPAPIAVRLAGLSDAIHITDTLDAALEWWEETVLAGLPSTEMPSLAALLAAEFERPDQAAAFLGLLERAEFAPGEALMCQGELSDDLLFIEAGQASVTVRFGQGQGPPMRVRTFGVGTMVGEIGFCLGLPRTATVTADGVCSVLRLTRRAMQRLEIEHPAAALAFQRAVLRRISERLLTKDELISALTLDRAR